jgi:D-serine deaminase-like pyridoxal phosphate-dependent protein
MTFNLTTPSFLVDLDVLEENVREMARLCRENKKRLWPMVKTHKSTQIAAIQEEAGAEGFLVGTLDEAEKLAESGFKNLMLAYPAAGTENIRRVMEIAKRCRLIISLDGVEAAQEVETVAAISGVNLEFLIIIDSGLHRFGVFPRDAVELAVKLSKFKHLKLKGVGTHPGHVYGASNREEVEKAAEEEAAAVFSAAENLKKAGFDVDMVAVGSTPTARFAIMDRRVNVVRPGNYVFYDSIQVALGVVPEERCALSVLGTIISHPRPDTLIMDVGSKCLGLDKGAHGISLVKGYGIIKGHPELLITDLSEEVGKIKIIGSTSIKVGDRVQVIPNHACSAANMTDYLLGHRKGKLEKTIYVDARGGTVRKPVTD